MKQVVGKSAFADPIFWMSKTRGALCVLVPLPWASGTALKSLAEMKESVLYPFNLRFQVLVVVVLFCAQ